MSNNFNKLYQKFTIARGKTVSIIPSSRAQNFTRPQFDLIKKIQKKHIIYGSVFGIIVLSFFAGRFFSPSNSRSISQNKRIDAPAPLATESLNKSFKFPLRDDKGKEVSRITYLLEAANLQDSFIYQGKLATAVKGREFLIFDLKITNPYSKIIEINARDYIRIKVNNSSEQLAPEIHNDPVQIQANSTKYTRIGLPINESDKSIVLLIGELQGKKETVTLNLKK